MLDFYWKIGTVTQNPKSSALGPLTCNHCGPKVHLIPSRFIVACINGHIDDFPYVVWAHRRKGICKNPRLKLEYKGKTGGLDSIYLYCETCNDWNNMEGSMGKDSLKGHKCKGKMPWLGKDYIDPENCTAQLRVLQRGASNVYYPVNQSILTIPPWSNIAQQAIDDHYETLEDIFDEDDDEVKTGRLAKFYSRKEIEKVYGITLDIFIREAFKRFERRDEEITEKSLMINEYKAFCQPDVDDPYFKTSEEPVPADVGTAIK